jgi:ribonuclease HI
MNLVAWTDGGFSYHESIGSWAFILLNQKTDYRIERYALTDHHKQTSQVSEIMAILKLLECVKYDLCNSNNQITKKITLDIYSDSQYCVNTIKTWMHGWAKKSWNVDKQNLDLWKQIHSLYLDFKQINMHWVKGHAGIDLNEQVDKLTNIPLQVYRR